MYAKHIFYLGLSSVIIGLYLFFTNIENAFQTLNFYADTYSMIGLMLMFIGIGFVMKTQHINEMRKHR